jgi:hypothetical protein
VTDVVQLTDLPAAVQANEMVSTMLDGANAKAARVAPCLVDTETAPSAGQLAEARLVLIGAIQRWHQAGTGAVSTEQVGPFMQSFDTRQPTRGYNLWPSEIKLLQEICQSGGTGSARAFSITPAAPTGAHLPWCALNFGATYCSCGVDIAGQPIFELAEDDTY